MHLRNRLGAKRDMIEAASWYERNRVGEGGRFMASVNAVVSILLVSPYAGTKVKRGVKGHEVRWFKTTTYPYLIHYEVTPTEIVVLSVTDARRRGHPWRQRL